MTPRFEALYRQRFAFTMPGVPLVVESVSVEMIGAADGADAQAPAPAAKEHAAPVRTVETYMAGGLHATPVYDRALLPPGQTVAGPAVIFDSVSTTVVEPGWAAVHTASGDLIIDRVERTSTHTNSTAADPVRLETFNNLFMSVAEQMGLALQNTAYSVNIKERLDFSCALFDASGALIANAPHMPVHLGSMSGAIRTVIAGNPRLAPGEAFVLNDPYHGGTHLPDVT